MGFNLGFKGLSYKGAHRQYMHSEVFPVLEYGTGPENGKNLYQCKSLSASHQRHCDWKKITSLENETQQPTL
jgi:hypothetical protein